MMKLEHEFRVWDPLEKFYATENFFLNKDGTLYYQHFWDNGESDIYPAEDHLIIERCTGLRNEHGTLIFEGDIVTAWSQGLGATGEVKHRIDGLWFMYSNYQHKQIWGLCPGSNGIVSVEVVGNIHENPELLEGGKP